MLIAQIPVDGLQLFGWLGCAGAVLWILNLGRSFMAGFKETPPPNETYVRKEQFKDQQDRLKELKDDLKSLRGEVQDLAKELREATSNLPSRIFAMLRNSGDIRGK